MTVMLTMNPAEYGCNLPGFTTATQCAKRWSDVVCLDTVINCGVRPLESFNYQILIGCCFEGKDVCRYLSQIIPRILHEDEANNHVMLYG